MRIRGILPEGWLIKKAREGAPIVAKSGPFIVSEGDCKSSLDVNFADATGIEVHGCDLFVHFRDAIATLTFPSPTMAVAVATAITRTIPSSPVGPGRQVSVGAVSIAHRLAEISTASNPRKA